MSNGESADAGRQICAIEDDTGPQQAAIEAASVGTWDYDLVANRRKWSKQLRALIGLPPDAPPDVEQFIAAIHPDDREAVIQRYSRVFDPANGGEYENEYRIIRREDGAERWIASRGRIFFDKSGQPIRAMGVMRDITARKHLEEEQRRLGALLEQQVAARTGELAETNQKLRDSEASYRALYGQAPVPLYSLDAAARVIDVNQQWLDLLGYRREEVIGRPITDFHSKAGSYLKRWQELLEKGSASNIERQFATKSGGMVDTLISAQVERDAAGAFRRVISAVINITARKEAERALRRERQFSELLIASSTEGIAAIDTELRYTVWNPSIAAMLG
ncbi:MAG: PAS domain S-box protein, partial [Alphaproteobacteria bacterium]|nr:PAS domain S-box protein [Alphaproteobacteria bacterium]